MRSTTLKEVAHYKWPVPAPFNFRYTFWKPSHFRTELEVHSQRTSWRTFIFGERIIGARFGCENDAVVARVFADRELSDDESESLQKRIVYSYGLHEDVAEFLKVAASHRATADTLKLLAGMRMSCPESVFEISILSVLLQNTTVARSKQMLDSLLRHYGKVVTFDGTQLRCFFTPARLARFAPETLRERCRLGYRAPTISAIAEYFSQRNNFTVNPLSMLPQASLRDDLLAIRGIGPFSADVIASHALRNTSEPALDVWNTRIAAKRLRMGYGPDREQVRARLKRSFQGYAALALLYMVEAECSVSPLVDLVPDRVLQDN